MRIFLLKVIDAYELRMGMLEAVIRASSEKHARQIAFEQAEHDLGREDWLDSAKSTCEALAPNGNPEIILCYTPYP